jgi:hypothetical protein
LDEGLGGFYLLRSGMWENPQIIKLTGELGRAIQWGEKIKSGYGLKRFEGRSWKGLHHHVALCFMAYLFRRRF